jgi:hypothetical protein
MATEGWQRNPNCLLRRPSKTRQNLRRTMLPSSLSFTQIWIWRLTAIQNTARMCAANFVSFTKLLLHHLMKSKCNVCPSPNIGEKVEEMIDWVVGEVKAMSDTVW